MNLPLQCHNTYQIFEMLYIYKLVIISDLMSLGGNAFCSYTALDFALCARKPSLKLIRGLSLINVNAALSVFEITKNIANELNVYEISESKLFTATVLKARI